jgi:hypothetical protein
MKLKTFAVAAFAAAGLVLGAGAADAKTKVRIGIGDNCGLYGENCLIPSPGDGYDGGYDQDTGIYYRHQRPRYRDDNDDDDDYGRLSCGEARRMVRRQGFRRVQADDCSGRRYRFTAFRRGEAFSIRVSARSGRIVSIRPLDY